MTDSREAEIRERLEKITPEEKDAILLVFEAIGTGASAQIQPSLAKEIRRKLDHLFGK